MATGYFEQRRIGLCGSFSEESALFDAFCIGAGRAFARSGAGRVAVVGRKDARGKVYADARFADGLSDALSEEDLPNFVDTFRHGPEAGEDESQYFRIGEVVETHGATREARRLHMVHVVDGLFAVGGTSGTAQQMTFATATSTRLLPVPTFGGAAEEHWREHRDLFIGELRIDEKTAARWEAAPEDADAAEALGAEMARIFLRSLVKRCFVVMPFADEMSALIDFVIDPAVRRHGDEPVHLGRLANPGDVGQQIREGIETADYAICVLDGLRPNVLYELGMVHALRKRVVILWKKTPDRPEIPPFDIVQEQRIDYERVDHALLNQVAEALGRIRVR